MSPRASWPPTAGGRLRPGVARVVVAAAVGVLVALLGVWFMPRVPSLSTQMTGDRDLAAKSRPYLDGALDVVSIATVDGATVNYAGFGADETAVYEIGSLTKTFTSALLADAISRGEVTADTRLADLLPVRGAPVADVTLAELASHRSGLPRVGTRPTIRENLLLLTHRTAYTQNLDGLLDVARSARLINRGRYLYSDLGYALLGEGLASAAHTDYPRLLHQRLLGPLGMTSTTVPITDSDLPADASAGYGPDGQRHKAWAMHAWAPAGGIRSTELLIPAQPAVPEPVCCGPARPSPGHREAEHHAALHVLGDVAVGHPQAGVGDVEQDVDGLAGADQDGVLPHQVRFRRSVAGQDEEAPAPCRWNGWCIG